jgi:hypothetical protein
MTGSGIKGVFRLLILVLLANAPYAWAVEPSDTGNYAHQAKYEFQKENHKLTGKWEGGEQWKARWCDGYYRYTVDLGGALSTVDFELNDNGTIAVYADLKDLFGAANGVYRSPLSLCIPLRGWTGLGMDRAELFAEVKFRGDGENLSEIDVRVVSTKLGTVHIGKYVPRWMERALTNILNRALSKVWASRLGEWLSDKISDIIKKKIPVDANGNFSRGGHRR